MTKCHNFNYGMTIDKSKKNKKKTNKNMVRMLHDNVLVLPFEVEEKTKGGIIIPSTAKEKPTKGTVVSVGPGKKDDPMEVKEGDIVYYGKYSGTIMEMDNEEYVILKQNDIYCVS